MRLTRLVVGFAIVTFATWIIIAEQMAGASANAVINTRLSTLDTPIAGRVELPALTLGTAVTKGQPLAAVEDPMADQVRLNDLDLDRVFAEAEITRLEEIIGSTGDLMDALRKRSDAFTEGQLADLTLRLSHARERLDIVGFGDARDDPETAQDGSAASLEESRVAEEADIAENALTSAEDGVFIGNGYNDAPNAEQHRVELLTVIGGLEADLRAARTRLEAIETRLDAERLAVNRLRSAEIASNVDGQVWAILSADGEHLQRGEPVLRLVDCGAIFVTLSVTENVYNRLRIGDPAEFRLSGSGTVYEGTVTRLAGPGAATIYQNLAIAPSPQHLERYDVALSVPGLEADPALQCPVGRTGRAFFSSRPLDPIRGLF